MSKEAQIAIESLERYSGSAIEDFQKNLILTNFPKYVDYFAKSRRVEIQEGSMFKCAHCKKEKVSILDFRVGSTAAALVVDLCSFADFETAIFLGMAGGLRRRYKMGDYLVPVAAIRGEGTSNYYFPIEIPALANFLMQRAVTHILERHHKVHHVGITYTTNKRFWEFDEDFKAMLMASKAQAKELECATLFMASYKRKFTLGALLLISDLPLEPEGVKTKDSSKKVYDLYMKEHVELGIEVLSHAQEMLKRHSKGSYRSTSAEKEENEV
jgi:AMP nucleosidase